MWYEGVDFQSAVHQGETVQPLFVKRETVFCNMGQSLAEIQ